MHFLIAFLAVLAGLTIWYWRLKILSSMARDGMGATKIVRNLPRRLSFKRKSGKSGLQLVDDPREAATILMLQVASARGPLTDAQKAAIRTEIENYFQFDAQAADELIKHAAWLMSEVGKPHAIVARMTDLVQHAPGLGPEEIVDLDSMLVTVSEAEGSPSRAQLDLLALFRQKTGLRV